MLNPRLLYVYAPLAWKTRSLVAGALAAFIMGGCSPQGSGSDARPGPEGERSKPAIRETGAAGARHERNQTQPAERKTPAVAPIFVHGEGRGATGCVVIAPPVFLTEAEAEQVIREEMGKTGITIDQEELLVQEVMLPRRSRRGVLGKAPLRLSGYSSAQNLGYAYVSEENYLALGGSQAMSSVQDYDFRGIAENVREKLAVYGKMRAAVFYDPACSQSDEEVMKRMSLSGRREEPNEELMEAYSERSKALLRAQVRDFLKWLKGST